MSAPRYDKIPKSIEFDPEVRAKYKTARDYWYHEDPVYHDYLDQQNLKRIQQYAKNDPDYWKNRHPTPTLTPEGLKKRREYGREYRRAHRDKNNFLAKLKYHDGITKPTIQQGRKKKGNLPFGLELRE